MEAFFVISGFVIPLSMDRRSGAGSVDTVDYVVRRLGRIFPAYAFSVIISIILLHLSIALIGLPSSVPSASTIALNLTFLAPWFDAPWISPVYWSLAIEMQFYLMMILVAPLVLSRNVRVLLIGGLVLSALSLVPSDDRLILGFLPVFAVGSCLFLERSGRITTTAAWIAAVVFALLACRSLGLAEGLCALVCFCMLRIRIEGRMEMMTFLGAISYSLFLLHVPIGMRVINLAVRLPQSTLIECLALSAATGLSILAAYLMWRFVEVPGMSAAHLLLSSRKKSRPAGWS